MARTPRSIALLAVSLVLIAPACVDVRARTADRPPTTGGEPATPAPAPFTVAYLQNASAPDALELLAPAQLAMRLAVFDAVERGELPAGSDVVAFDVGEDLEQAVGVAERLRANAEVSVAVVAPLTHLPPPARDMLSDAGIPILSLSGLTGAPPEGAWLRMVASVGHEARAVADRLDGREPACLIQGDSTVFSARALPALERALRRGSPAVPAVIREGGDVADALGQARCHAVVWAGPATGAAGLRAELDRAGLGRLPLTVLDPARTVSFLEATTSSRGRTTAVCACVDISTSAEPDAVTLLHRFQAQYGIGLGPFGVEGWDAGTLLVRAAGNRPTRPSMAAAIGSLTSFSGLGGVYAFDEDGERADAPVYLYRATGARWLLLQATGS